VGRDEFENNHDLHHALKKKPLGTEYRKSAIIFAFFSEKLPGEVGEWLKPIVC